MSGTRDEHGNYHPTALERVYVMLDDGPMSGTVIGYRVSDKGKEYRVELDHDGSAVYAWPENIEPGQDEDYPPGLGPVEPPRPIDPNYPHGCGPSDEIPFPTPVQVYGLRGLGL